MDSLAIYYFPASIVIANFLFPAVSIADKEVVVFQQGVCLALCIPFEGTVALLAPDEFLCLEVDNHAFLVVEYKGKCSFCVGKRGI